MEIALKKYLSTYIPLKESDWQIIQKYFVPITVPPYNFLLKEDQICRHLYFLEAGVIRYFYLKDGNEITKFFTFPQQIFTSPKSFSQQRPSEESIQTLKASKVHKISYDQLQLLYQEVPLWSTLIRKILLEVSDATESLFLAANNKTAEQRYLELLKEEPEVIREVPLKFIASYLGISPESLSRIRKKVR